MILTLSSIALVNVQGYRVKFDLQWNQLCDTMLCPILSWSKLDPTLVDNVVFFLSNLLTELLWSNMRHCSEQYFG